MLRPGEKFSLPELEEKILKFWKEHRIFERTLAEREKAKPFRFFEGPPTANGRPGLHHVMGRVFKDVILRYKTMRGYYVLRRAGWDTHGLPVEIAVEKELGIKNKQEIEKFGIAEFNERARMSVWKYKTEWERLTERIGFWLDFGDPYITYDNRYIETLWWVLSRAAKRGFLKKLHRVVPWCPRCQTPLSTHELGQPGGYQKIKDPSVYVKFRLLTPRRGKAVPEYLLVWTTTPWTLPSNVAVAVHPKLVYTKFRVGDEYVWSHNPPPALPGKEIEVTEKLSGQKLEGLRYEPLYPPPRRAADWYRVVGAEFVEVAEGTGLVHIAPAFGEEDLSLWQSLRRRSGKALDVPQTVDERGLVTGKLPGTGKFAKGANRAILDDLTSRGLLYQSGTVEHDYPHCWRCSSPLIYFARESWFIEMSKLRAKLVAENEKINWIPAHLKHGRFGEWLKEAKDWAISRERFWGTPLPIWECQSCGKPLVVGGLADLDTHAFSRNIFYAVRHGEAEHNLDGTVACGSERGQRAPRLTELGQEQAEATARELRRKGLDLIFTSPFRRARGTAQIIAKVTGARVIVDKRLGELNQGIFDGGPVSEYRKFFSSFSERFYKTPPGGENLAEAKRRMIDLLADVSSRYSGQRIAVVGHGDPLWVMLAAAEGLPNQKTEKLPYPALGSLRPFAFHNWPRDRAGELDLHRPFADRILLRCSHCRGAMKRVKEVADVWFDSGAMPFAEWHYPFENKKVIDGGRHFPADYIAEGVDQTRGWFYTLLAVAVLLGKEAPYRNVLCYGLLLDKHGQKMSKSKGNVVDPWEMAGKYGADALRWYFLGASDPGEPKRFDEEELAAALRRFFLILYNSYSFWHLYADRSAEAPLQSRHPLDRWLIGRLNETGLAVSRALDRYAILAAVRELETFADDLSRWYIRRSRRRFAPETNGSEDHRAASGILFAALLGAAKLLAPFAPFFAELLYQSLKNRVKGEHLTDSVHLEEWPRSERGVIDRGILESMKGTRAVAAAALALRAEAGIKVRQPLGQLKVKSDKLKGREELLRLLADEVNVKEIVFDPKMEKEFVLDTAITPKLREEGILREIIRNIQQLRQKAGLKVGEAAEVSLAAPEPVLGIVRGKEAEVKKAVGAREVKTLPKNSRGTGRFDAEIETEDDEGRTWIGIRKI